MNKAIYLIVGALILLIITKKTMKRQFYDYLLVIFRNEFSSKEPDKIIVDSGGITKYGISDLADGITDKKYFGKPIESMTIGEATEIYKKNYFTPFAQNFTQFPNVALELFDISVNAGLSRAKEFLKNVVGTSNPNDAISKISFMGENEVLSKLKNERIKHYTKLAENVKYKPYLKGWLNRVQNTKFLI